MDEEYGLKVLKDLISFPTVVPPGENYRECAEYLYNELKNFGLKVEFIEVPKAYLEKYLPKYSNYPRYIVIGRLGKGRPVLHFNGHYDVVPAGGDWKVTKPFEPKVVNGKVFGRGASDMKGGIASILMMLKTLVEEDYSPNGTIEVSFTPDEEIGGRTGVGFMLEAGLVDPDYCIIGEPSGVHNIWHGHKGAVWLELVFHGKSAHASRPWMGENAFEKMVEVAYRIIHELKPRIESKVSKYDYGVEEGKKASINLGGVVKGGLKINIVPDKCSFTIDRRVIPEETADEAEKEIIEFLEEIARENPKLKVEVKVLGKSNACVVNPNSKICKIVSKAVEETTGVKPSLTMCMGGLDLKYFVNRGIEGIAYGPGLLTQSHVTDEYVLIDDIVKVAQAYTKTVKKLL